MNLCILKVTFTCSWKTVLVVEQKTFPTKRLLPAVKTQTHVFDPLTALLAKYWVQEGLCCKEGSSEKWELKLIETCQLQTEDVNDNLMGENIITFKKNKEPFHFLEVNTDTTE